jgi:uncharacterized phage-associated protein
MPFPAIGQPLIHVRFSVFKRFVLTITLEPSDGWIKPMFQNIGSFDKQGVYARYMPSVHDVAKYILHEQGSMSTWKLQKLVYYSQAWHLVWEEEPLFSEPIEAWADGPVVPDLFKLHRGKFTIGSWPRGKRGNLTATQRESIDAVLSFYGDKSGHWLSELTHQEAPWREARKGLSLNERGHRRIKPDALARYYAALVGAPT